MKRRTKVTLNLPEALLAHFRVYAAARGHSMSVLMTEAVQSLLDNDRDWESAKRRSLEHMRNAPDSGRGEVRNWTRDGIHTR